MKIKVEQLTGSEVNEMVVRIYDDSLPDFPIIADIVVTDITGDFRTIDVVPTYPKLQAVTVETLKEAQ